MRLGMGELLVVLAIVFLLFGARRLPDIAKSIGLSIKEFKKISKETDETGEEAA